MSRPAAFAVFLALFGVCAFLCHGVVGIYFGVGMRVGDAVIVEGLDGLRIPATVIGFSDRGAKVRSEEPSPALHGQILNFPYDQCRVVSRESEEWVELTGQGVAASTVSDAGRLASPPSASP